MGFVSRENLKKMLLNYVVEVKYQRRHPKPETNTCRLFCIGAYPNFHTNAFLATISASSAFGYRFPKGVPPYPPKPPYDPDQKNLVITWSIFDADYRSITVHRCNVIRAFPVNTKENVQNFWDHFTKYIAPMSVQEKTDFKLK